MPDKQKQNGLIANLKSLANSKSKKNLGAEETKWDKMCVPRPSARLPLLRLLARRRMRAADMATCRALRVTMRAQVLPCPCGFEASPSGGTGVPRGAELRRDLAARASITEHVAVLGAWRDSLWCGKVGL